MSRNPMQPRKQFRYTAKILEGYCRITVSTQTDIYLHCQLLSQAIYNIPLVGIQTITGYSEEDFEKMDAYSSQLMRLGQKIAMKVSRLDEVLALLQLTGTASTFNPKYL